LLQLSAHPSSCLFVLFAFQLHPQDQKASAAEPEKEKSALQDMFFDGSNLGKDMTRTQPVHQQPAARVLHEQPASIKAAP
jgi:hypothetical protein